jgi:hypothetical protein
MIQLQQVRAGHGRFKAAHDAMVQGVLEAAGQNAMAEIVLGGGGTGFKHRTGAVIRGQKNRVYARIGGHVLELSNSAPHAVFLEKGTRPHVILPKHKSALHFHWPKAGGWIFAKRVQHPGTRAYHFLSGARDRAFVATAGMLRNGMATVANHF